jgi:hypothetical protein
MKKIIATLALIVSFSTLAVDLADYAGTYHATSEVFQLEITKDGNVILTSSDLFGVFSGDVLKTSPRANSDHLFGIEYLDHMALVVGDPQIAQVCDSTENQEILIVATGAQGMETYCLHK